MKRRLSASDRLTFALFGAVVSGAAAWGAWWLVGEGEVLVGIGVSTLAVVGTLTLWSAVTVQTKLPERDEIRV